MTLFTSTTLDNVVKSYQARSNGVEAWRVILSKVQGGTYNTELKRQGDTVIDSVFFDPSKNFTFEKYFDKHVIWNELHAASRAPVSE